MRNGFSSGRILEAGSEHESLRTKVLADAGKRSKDFSTSFAFNLLNTVIFAPYPQPTRSPYTTLSTTKRPLPYCSVVLTTYTSFLYYNAFVGQVPTNANAAGDLRQ